MTRSKSKFSDKSVKDDGFEPNLRGKGEMKIESRGQKIQPSPIHK